MYLWFSLKLPSAFIDAPLAASGRALVADIIREALEREAPLQGARDPDDLVGAPERTPIRAPIGGPPSEGLNWGESP